MKHAIERQQLILHHGSGEPLEWDTEPPELPWWAEEALRQHLTAAEETALRASLGIGRPAESSRDFERHFGVTQLEPRRLRLQALRKLRLSGFAHPPSGC